MLITKNTVDKKAVLPGIIANHIKLYRVPKSKKGSGTKGNEVPYFSIQMQEWGNTRGGGGVTWPTNIRGGAAGKSKKLP